MLPLLIALMAAVLAVGVAFFQVGRTADLRAQAQTEADAAALAGAQDIRGQYLDYLRSLGPVEVDRAGLRLFDALRLFDLSGRAAAEEYARRNGGRLIGYERRGTDVLVTVETIGAVDGPAARRLGVEGTRAQARARARMSVRFLGLPPVLVVDPPPAPDGTPPPPVLLDPGPLFAFQVRLVPMGG